MERNIDVVSPIPPKVETSRKATDEQLIIVTGPCRGPRSGDPSFICSAKEIYDNVR